MCLRRQSEVKEQYILSCQLMEQQKEASGPSEGHMLAAGMEQQLQLALDQLSCIQSSLCDIQLHYQDLVRTCRRGNQHLSAQGCTKITYFILLFNFYEDYLHFCGQWPFFDDPYV